MKILVCGGRDYTDYDRLEDELNLLWRVHDGRGTEHIKRIARKAGVEVQEID